MKNCSTFLTVWVEVSYIFRFTLGVNYRVHGIQLRDGGLILCWRRIRKFDENKQTNRQTENRHTENSKPEATLIPVDRRGEQANIYIYRKDNIQIGLQNFNNSHVAGDIRHWG